MSQVVVEFADAQNAYRALAELRRLSLVTETVRIERTGRQARLLASDQAWSKEPLQDVCRRFGGIVREARGANAEFPHR